MPTFAYKALDGGGAAMQGTIVAENRKTALSRLFSQGHNVTEIVERGKGTLSADRVARRGPRMRLGELIATTRQLATLTASGVPLVQGITVLVEQMQNARINAVMTDVRREIQGGSTFSAALAKYPRCFPSLMVSMVRVGEVGGFLESVLHQLADLFDRQQRIRSEVRAALAYPVLVLGMGLASAVVLMTVVIPRLTFIFEGAGQALPTPTAILLGASDFLGSYWWLVLLGAVASVAGVRFALRQESIRLAVDGAKLRIPIIGAVLRKSAVARFARCLGTLLKNGVSLVQSLGILKDIVGNAAIARSVERISGQIREGSSLARLLRDEGTFPPIPVQMVATGEETGQLDEMLLRVAEGYEQETSAATRMMTSLLAPLLILFVAAIVGFMIVAMLLPILTMSTIVQ